MRLYGDLDAQYGKEVDPTRTYGTLFDQDPAPEEGLTVLFARVGRLNVDAIPDTTSVMALVVVDGEVFAVPDSTSVAAKVTSLPVGWSRN